MINIKMNNDVEIRFAREEDVPEIIKLCQQHAIFEQAEYDKSGKEEKLKMHLFSDQPDLKCLVALKNNVIVGYATYMKQFSTWDAGYYIYMDCLFLQEGARGAGIGELLMMRIKAEAAKSDCNLIQWQTPDFNTRAMKFYRRIGAYSKTKERFFLEI